MHPIWNGWTHATSLVAANKRDPHAWATAEEGALYLHEGSAYHAWVWAYGRSTPCVRSAVCA
jgi:hypothetical protein